MTFEELLHAVRAAADVAGTDELLVFGSQAILLHDPEPPIELRQSIEIDVVPIKFPERSDQIDGALGELSQFHSSFGFYVHGVGFETASFPQGWESRWRRVYLGRPPVTVIVPEIHDLAASKLAAGRDKDFEYVAVLLAREYVTAETLLHRVDQLRIDDEPRARIHAWVGAVARQGSG